MIPQEALNLFIVIFFIAYLIYEYIRDRKNEKKPAKVKAECIKRSGMEMTDNDIVKGLEYCVDKGYCPSCPCYDNASNCKIEYDALDLINRQKAEIKRLQNNNGERADHFAKLLEAERKKQKCMKKIAEREAIIGFAERLKSKYRHNTTSITSLVTLFDNIDNLVKEMAGEG